uniref:OmpA/MotB family protein n=1 Tax=Enterocloster sp. TaxID=2719315 RepID=UPI003FEF802D
MSKKNRPADSGGSWMDTYGDMVTLLLTFFIMLYSMSNLDAQKWSVFVKSIPSIQNQGSENITINSQMSDTPEADSTGQEIGQEGAQQDLQTADVNKLYLTIAESLNQAGVKDATVIRGDDYTYVSFANSVFFGANSSVLTWEGQLVLHTFAKAIAPAAGGIEQVNIMSHTAKVTDNSQINPQTIRKDRILSAMRSAEVCIYLQKQNVIKPEKLVDISYGEYRPIADNSTEEGRIKNRRIEFLLLDNGAKEKDLDEYYKEFKSGEYTNTTV